MSNTRISTFGLGSYLNTLYGKGIDYDGAMGYSSTDLIQHIVYKFWGQDKVIGDPKNYTQASFPQGFTKLPAIKDSLKMGDIITIRIAGMDNSEEVGIVVQIDQREQEQRYLIWYQSRTGVTAKYVPISQITKAFRPNYGDNRDHTKFNGKLLTPTPPAPKPANTTVVSGGMVNVPNSPAPIYTTPTTTTHVQVSTMNPAGSIETTTSAILPQVMRDTKPISDQVQRRSSETFFSIVYGSGPDAVDLGQMVDAITKINRGIGSGWTNTFSNYGSIYGQEWVKAVGDMKEITVDFIKEGDQKELERFRREMAVALDTTSGPKRLTFNDQPNGYYLAVTDGSIELDEDISELRATGTLRFIVPDGLFHSTFTKVLSPSADDSIGTIVTHDDHVELTINNAGTVESYPRIIIEHGSDNGYIGIVNQNGVMELGGTPDTRPTTTSQVLVNVKWGDGTNTGWGGWEGLNTVTSVMPHSILDGLVTDRVKIGRELTRFNSAGIMKPDNDLYKEGYKWASAGIVKPLPADSSGKATAQNFRLDFNAKFYQSALGQTGHIVVGVMDSNKELIAAYEISKTDRQGSYSEVNFYTGIDTVRRTEGFHANNGESTSHRTNVAFSEYNGGAAIVKEGSRITFHYASKHYSFNVPAAEKSEARFIYVAAGQLSGVRGTAVAKMIVETLSFTKFDVERWDLVKNRYMANSKITVDQRKGVIYYAPDNNEATIGAPHQAELVHGSTFFSIPKGTSTLKVFFSTWVKTKPKVMVEWEESWR